MNSNNRINHTIACDFVCLVASMLVSLMLLMAAGQQGCAPGEFDVAYYDNVMCRSIGALLLMIAYGGYMVWRDGNLRTR